MDIKILVASHKKAEMPEDSMYLPVHVGRVLYPDREFGYQSDAEGDNISIKNPYYCELTALYWAWKNLKADYVGLAHYRRHFSLKTVHRGGWNSVLTGKQAEILCRKHDIILPKNETFILKLSIHIMIILFLESSLIVPVELSVGDVRVSGCI